MNQVFDFSRWGLLVRKHWSDNRNKYTLSIVAIAALLVMWFGFLLLVDGRNAMNQDGQIITFYVGLFLTGALFASMLFSDLANKPKAINFLSVPASQFEKVLCMALFCILIFFVSYTVIFYAADFIMVKVANAVNLAKWKEKHAEALFVPETVANVFATLRSNDTGNPFNALTTVALLFFAVQGAYVLGSIYFPAYSFIKTTIALLLVFLFFVFLIAKVLAPILPAGSFSSALTIFNLPGPGNEWGRQMIQLPSWTDDVFFGYFKYVLTPVFWVVTYFRLKEKEV